jgi:hypothetical protein
MDALLAGILEDDLKLRLGGFEPGLRGFVRSRTS